MKSFTVIRIVLLFSISNVIVNLWVQRKMKLLYACAGKLSDVYKNIAENHSIAIKI